MSEILFRGKETLTNNWIEGGFVKTDNYSCILHQAPVFHLSEDANQQLEDISFPFIPVAVHPETIGQYTGLEDKNGIKIFEGDVIAIPYITPNGQVTDDIDRVVRVEYSNSRFGFWTEIQFMPLSAYFEWTYGDYVPNHGQRHLYDKNHFTVIGNIHDNPELMEK